MGRAARLNAQGLKAPGIGSGNPKPTELFTRHMRTEARDVRFSDRAYIRDGTGAFRRVKIVAPTPTP